MLGNPYLTKFPSTARALPALRAAGVAAVSAAIMVGIFALPATASPAAPAPHAGLVAAAVGPDSCAITTGQMTWGFKESFRAYISGTIAHGEWTTSGGATYATPEFGWSGGTGTFDPAGGAGEAAFAGGIRFTGHDGLLDTSVSNPTLRFAGDGTAQLLVDLSSVSMEDALAGGGEGPQTFTQLPIVNLDLASAPLQESGDGTVSGVGVPTSITAEGFEAFGNYEPGTAFDPLTFTLTLDCAGASAAPTPTAAAEPEVTTLAGPEAEPASDAEPASGTGAVWPWIVGGAVLGALAAFVVWLVRRRRAVLPAGSTVDGAVPPAGSPVHEAGPPARPEPDERT